MERCAQLRLCPARDLSLPPLLAAAEIYAPSNFSSSPFFSGSSPRLNRLVHFSFSSCAVCTSQFGLMLDERERRLVIATLRLQASLTAPSERALAHALLACLVRFTAPS